MEIREARADDGVGAVIAAAFGRPEVVALAADLAGGDAHLLSLVAETTPGLVGHVQVSRGWVDAADRPVPVAVLSPLSVLPGCQRHGIGSALVEAACARADEAGWPLVLLEGDPLFYRRLGFVAAGPSGLTRPSGRIPAPGFQVRPLGCYDPGLRGAVVYPDAFWRHDAVGLRGHGAQGARQV